MTQQATPETPAFPDGNEIEYLRVLRAILAELQRQGQILDKAAGFIDNPVTRYRQSMRENRRGRRDTD